MALYEIGITFTTNLDSVADRLYGEVIAVLKKYDHLFDSYPELEAYGSYDDDEESDDDEDSYEYEDDFA